MPKLRMLCAIINKMERYPLTSSPLYWIAANRIEQGFPDPDQALAEPDGLLAAGGDLSSVRLLEAYRKGIFPWYQEDQPILWWSPNPRTVLFPESLKVSRGLRKILKRRCFRITVDQAFEATIRACAEPRRNRWGTWLVEEMIRAYIDLYDQGYAHSVECWYEDNLAGGVYGVAIGQVFFGESMFSRMDNASKVALVDLVQLLLKWDYHLIDCQVHSDHLEHFGAIRIRRDDFIDKLDKWCPVSPHPHAWRTVLP